MLLLPRSKRTTRSRMETRKKTVKRRRSERVDGVGLHSEEATQVKKEAI